MLIDLLVAGAACVPQGAPLASLATAPSDHLLTVIVAKPGRAIGDIVGGMKDLSLWEGVSISFDPDDSLAEFGVDVTDPSTWSRVGIDLERSARVVLDDPGGFLNLPQRVCTDFGIADRVVALRFLSMLHEGAEVVGGEPEVFATEREAWATLGGRGYVLSTSGGGDRDPAALLRENLGRVGSAPTIGADPLFGTLRRRAQGTFECAVFCSVHEGMEKPEAPVRSVLALLTDEAFEIAFAPRPGATWTESLETGAECRACVAKFPPPVMAASASLADPLALLGRLEREENFDGGEILRKIVELGGDDDAASLRHSAAAALAYPRDGSMDKAWFAACVKLPGDQKAWIERLAADEEVREVLRRAEDGWLRGEVDGAPFCIGVIDDCVVFGDAEDALHKAANAEGAAWEPLVAGERLFAVEVDLDRLVRTSGAAPELLARIQQSGRLLVTAEREDAGLVVRSELVGAAGDDTFLKRLTRVVALLIVAG